MIFFVAIAVLAQSEPAPKPSEIDSPGLARTIDGQPGTAQQDADAIVPPPVVVVPPPVALSEPAPAPKDKWKPKTFLTVNGIGGVGAGVILIPVPAPIAAPFVGFGIHFERKLHTASYLELGLDLSLGNSESGKPIGGYSALATFGTAWINTRFFVFESRIRGGLSSFLLIPLPQLGGVAALILQPWRGDIFRWRFAVEPALDFVFFVPVFSGGVSTELRWDFKSVHFGAKIGGGYTLGLITGAGVAASAKLFAGVGF